MTGAKGSIGSALVSALAGQGLAVAATDKDSMDVTDSEAVRSMFARFEPTLVYHLAGAKSAPGGEETPEEALFVNGVGTWNVVSQGVPTVTASTCKACDPETAYGASKLLAERMTLNAGGWVARFYNVRESCGNVFEAWRELPEQEPLPVSPCYRYFISLPDALHLLKWTPRYSPGRYTVDPGRALSMAQAATLEYPGRPQAAMGARRGDRLAEPRHALCETFEDLGRGLFRVTSPHDPC